MNNNILNTHIHFTQYMHESLPAYLYACFFFFFFRVLCLSLSLSPFLTHTHTHSPHFPRLYFTSQKERNRTSNILTEFKTICGLGHCVHNVYFAFVLWCDTFFLNWHFYFYVWHWESQLIRQTWRESSFYNCF